MKLDEIKDRVGALWESVAEGWQHLMQSAAGALTRFKPVQGNPLPTEGEVDDGFYLPSRGWAVLGGDVFEDDRRLVVRLELPGMDKQDIQVEVLDEALVVSGQKRFERESSDGRWRVMQCAYGSFRRVVPLSVAVRADEARAAYRNGVLRVELPKAAPGAPRSLKIEVD
ncbi:MAG: Hsp20/alpha crystallin family protein [Rhodocyclaceae bacterium]|nr:Hsp20/alpha crystallin family protein [Rhodocyclaceae bacterium]MCP5232598.1 Hsp20/alpha crystallin family protein [Zoogloeaceae bacterium]MCB1912590.1 Hsp20/alpha crystallin family protein [Rhodocyclaceae bacterium]MCP5240721.1 Hsp20/alpha crystallin family protein [Zoogloeaceae bacterium]MCP5253167.1 Hsp20/alpha crystallin family protein [Zoogloeaceae bacterium]